MSSRMRVMSVGNNPNLAFYNWRLYESKGCDLDVISTVSETESASGAGSTFNWSSRQFGTSRYSPSSLYQSLDGYLRSAQQSHYDFILLSASSLQELSVVFQKLRPLIVNQLEASGSAPAILIESTNFVNLEPFIKVSLQLDSVPVLSIMSDYDVRLTSANSFRVCDSKKESELLYIGRSGVDSKYSAVEIQLINQIAGLLESAGIDVYKLGTPLEFLSYQWKFALPKIALEPLSILFEKPFPSQLQQQILAKPLISGLISEVITVIKTMGCKLFKSYDTEQALLERCSQLYPEATKLSPDYSEAPKLFYDFYNQNELYLDLLLLQPILLADDFQVKTPYLEFLYAMLTQFVNSNTSTPDHPTSIFWLRSTGANVQNWKLKQREILAENAAREANIEKLQQEQRAKAQQTAQPAPQPMAPTPAQQMAQAPVTREVDGYSNGVNGSTVPVAQIVSHEDDLEDLSQMAAAYVINDTPQQPQQLQQPPHVRGSSFQGKPVANNIYAQQQYYQQQQQQPQPLPQPQQPQMPFQQGPPSPQYDQYGNVIRQEHFQRQPSQSMSLPQGGSSSPTFPPQQLPYGLPPQGLPQNQPIFSQQKQRRSSAMLYSDFQGVEQGVNMNRFKATSRKNRKSAMPNMLPGGINGITTGPSGMPRPGLQSQPSQPMVRNQNSFNNGRRPQNGSGVTTNGLGISNGGYPAPQQQQYPPPQQQQNPAQQQQPLQPQAIPAAQTVQNLQSSSGSLRDDEDSNGSAEKPQLQTQSGFLPVPEPAPVEGTPLGFTPAKADDDNKEKEKDKKKKRGFFGRKKKN